LSNSPNEGFIEIKHGSFWRRVNGKYWDKKREKMLCQHLGYKEMAANDIKVDKLGVGYSILIGDLICYDTQSNGTSCCVHLVPFETTSSIKMQYVRCEYGLYSTNNGHKIRSNKACMHGRGLNYCSVPRFPTTH
jgi:hypothetical protein